MEGEREGREREGERHGGRERGTRERGRETWRVRERDERERHGG